MEKRVADVSIVVANFNNGKYIPKFFSSIVGSTFHPRELIIVDDGSSDDSVSQLRSIAAQNGFVKLIEFPQNKGFANALNEGVAAATSMYIMRLDPDDYVAASRVEKQFKFLESNPEIDMVGSNITYFDSDSGSVIFNSNVPADSDNVVKAFQEGNCGIIHGSMMCRSKVMKQFRYDQKNVPAEDYELFSRMLRAGNKGCNMHDALTFVRIHVSSVSNNLPFETIQKTFRLKDDIWNSKTGYLTVKRMHLYLLNYRRFLFSKGLNRYWHLALAVLFNPMKGIARITGSH